MGRLGPAWVGMKKQGGWGPSLAVVVEGRAVGVEAGCPERKGWLASSLKSRLFSGGLGVLSGFQNHLRDHWSHSWGLGVQVGNHPLKVLPPPGRGVWGPGAQSLLPPEELAALVFPHWVSRGALRGGAWGPTGHAKKSLIGKRKKKLTRILLAGTGVSPGSCGGAIGFPPTWL